ncbi:helix-turn-helix domain-containing protein [Streptomyces sp. NPDC059695]|uniref:AraC-like ligand-binding domain-containing protein n=1 Tax=Streptomyces sp. NPDC059695 TaxID=3346910 RepID=UPI0036B0EA4D
MGSLVLPDADAAGDDRFDWFCETVYRDFMPVMLSTPSTADFRAGVRELDLGVVRLSSVACSPVVSRRTPTHVRRADPEYLQLGFVSHGEVRVSQHGNDSVIAGGLVLTDTSRPSEGACTDGRIETVVLHIPRQSLALSPDRVAGLLARSLPADAGSGAILADFLMTLHAQGPRCRPEELRALGTVALDLTTAFLARRLGDPGEAPGEARAQETLRRIYRFVETNLGDPGLTPEAIADRHSLSVRGLHRLFGDEPRTVAAHIRQSRLEHAHADLACGELSAQPVHVIAARWGFSSATGFSRAFRAAYGITPVEHRASSLVAPRHAEDRNTARPAHHGASAGPRFFAGDSATA